MVDSTSIDSLQEGSFKEGGHGRELAPSTPEYFLVTGFEMISLGPYALDLSINPYDHSNA